MKNRKELEWKNPNFERILDYLHDKKLLLNTKEEHDPHHWSWTGIITGLVRRQVRMEKEYDYQKIINDVRFDHLADIIDELTKGKDDKTRS